MDIVVHIHRVVAHRLDLGKVEVAGNKVVEDLQLGFGQIIFGNADVFERREIPGKAREPHKGFLGVCALVDDLCGGMPVRRIVELVLHDLEESDGLLAVGIVVDAGRVEVEHLTVEDLFRGADVADPVEQLFPIVAACVAFQPFVVQGESLDEIVFQYAVCPDAELRAAQRLHPVPYGDDDVEVVVIGRLGRKFGISEFSHGRFPREFPLGIDIADMFADGGFGFLKQIRHLLLREPHGVAVQRDGDLRHAVLGLIDDDFVIVHGVLHNILYVDVGDIVATILFEIAKRERFLIICMFFAPLNGKLF